MPKKTPALRTNYFNGFRLWLIILLPSALLYSVTWKFGFSSLDDQWLVPDNEPFLKSEQVLFRMFGHPVLGIYYRPVFMISLLVDYWISGTNPAGFHISNALLHLIATAVVLKFLLANHVEVRMAAALSVLFSLHPMQLHAVAWIPGRNDILLLIFSLCAIILLLGAVRNSSRKLFAGHLFFFFLALFTKETAVVLPLICFLFLWYEPLRSKRMTVVAICSWTVVSLVYGFARLAVVEAKTSGFQPLADHLRDFMLAINLYFGNFVIVLRQSVMPSINQSLFWPGIITILVIPAAIYYWGWRDRQRGLLGAAIVFLFLFLPVWFASATTSDQQYEHRAYLPLAGFALLISAIKFPTGRRTTFAVLVLASVYLHQSWKRVDIYRDQEVFAETGIRENPGYHLFYHHRAIQLMGRQQFPEAIELLNKSILLRPSWPQSYSLRAHCYYTLGRMKECIGEYNKLETLVPPNAAIFGNRMIVHWNLGDLKSALSDMHRMSEIPNSVQLPKPVLEVARKLVDSLNHTKTLADRPGSPAEISFRLGGMYLVIGDTAAAGFYFERARSADPANKTYVELAAKYGSAQQKPSGSPRAAHGYR